LSDHYLKATNTFTSQQTAAHHGAQLQPEILAANDQKTPSTSDGSTQITAIMLLTKVPQEGEIQ
jgi:hypothetical protein